MTVTWRLLACAVGAARPAAATRTQSNANVERRLMKIE
jgi:hypothetical protein